jgi:hypothetical protein
MGIRCVATGAAAVMDNLQPGWPEHHPVRSGRTVPAFVGPVSCAEPAPISAGMR